MKAKGSNYHPARISGRQKQMRVREWEKEHKEKEKPKVKPIDTKKNDWSLTNTTNPNLADVGRS